MCNYRSLDNAFGQYKDTKQSEKILLLQIKGSGVCGCDEVGERIKKIRRIRKLLAFIRLYRRLKSLLTTQ